MGPERNMTCLSRVATFLQGQKKKTERKRKRRRRRRKRRRREWKNGRREEERKTMLNDIKNSRPQCNLTIKLIWCLLYQMEFHQRRTACMIGTSMKRFIAWNWHMLLMELARLVWNLNGWQSGRPGRKVLSKSYLHSHRLTFFFPREHFVLKAFQGVGSVLPTLSKMNSLT